MNQAAHHDFRAMNAQGLSSALSAQRSQTWTRWPNPAACIDPRLGPQGKETRRLSPPY
jgi:hypothetical protein